MSCSKYSLPTNINWSLHSLFSLPSYHLTPLQNDCGGTIKQEDADGRVQPSNDVVEVIKLFFLKLWSLTAAFIVQYTLNVRSRGKQLCFPNVLIEMHMPLAFNWLIYTVPLYCGYVGLATNLLLFLLCASILQKHHFLTPWDQSQIPCCWSSSTFYSNDRQNFPKATTKTHKQRLIVSFPSSLSWVLDEHDNR